MVDSLEQPAVPMGPQAVAPAASDEKPEATPSNRAAVTEWLSRIEAAEKHWDGAFKRMRRSMNFVAGIQWDGQKNLVEEDRYIANITNRIVAQKVSALYAKDPKVKAAVKDRLYYALWDGKIETVAMAFQRLQAASLGLGVLDPNDMALIKDYENGNLIKQQLEQIGKTLEMFYTWQTEQQEPEFKSQMKQLVRRTVICGVGYVKLRVDLPFETGMSGDGVDSTPLTRMQRAHAMLSEMLEDGATQDDPRMAECQALLTSLSAGVDSAPSGISRLIFEFPVSTAIVPDPKCRQLKGFVGCDWVAERFVRPAREVEEFFEVELCEGVYDVAKQENVTPPPVGGRTEESEDADSMVICYEVYNKRSKSRFILCKGHDDFLVAPEAVVPPTRRFWPWHSLTFNDIEVEPGEESVKVDVFPPSDVELVMPMQKEWNRSRQALREHRAGSVPFAFTSVPFTDADKARLKAVEALDVIMPEGVPPNSDMSKLIVPFQPPKIDPVVYETQSLSQDVLMTVGTQEANLGPTTGATATESTIAEQSRVSNLSSNGDDIDDLLSDLARAGGELLMRTSSEAEVRAVCGPGALLPPAEQVDEYANEVYLHVEAASSGRPNKALDVSNFERMAPWLLQAGANPGFLVREGLKRLDERIPSEQAFPLVPGQASPLAAASPDAPQAAGGPRGKPTTKNMMPAPDGRNPQV